MRRPPVLCYHRVGGPPEIGVTRIGRRAFERQMRTLAERGWRALSLREFADRVQRGVAGSCREFLLTFDDGYASLDTHAYPVLREVGFTATTFLITEHVGRRNDWDARYTWRRLPHLGWRAIERWQAAGFDFGSHGARHRRLTWLRDDEAEDELRRSRDTLRAALGEAAARAVAYPFGACDARVRRLAGAIGYTLGFGGVHASGESLYLPRVPVYTWDRGVPFGLRDDALARVGRIAARLASGASVGTSLALALTRGRRERAGRREGGR